MGVPRCTSSVVLDVAVAQATPELGVSRHPTRMRCLRRDFNRPVRILVS